MTELHVHYTSDESPHDLAITAFQILKEAARNTDSLHYDANAALVAPLLEALIDKYVPEREP